MKKEGWGGGGTRQVVVASGTGGDLGMKKSSGKVLNVVIGHGLPRDTRKYRETRVTSQAWSWYMERALVVQHCQLNNMPSTQPKVITK